MTLVIMAGSKQLRQSGHDAQPLQSKTFFLWLQLVRSSAQQVPI
jgi:hypothetical protein